MCFILSVASRFFCIWFIVNTLFWHCKRFTPILNFVFQIQSEIVSVFMTFTKPVVQSADHEEGTLSDLTVTPKNTLINNGLAPSM